MELASVLNPAEEQPAACRHRFYEHNNPGIPSQPTMISCQNSTLRPNDKDWESRKHELFKLYMLDNMNLKIVMEEMTGRHLFCASQRMYKR
ncbi:hypothetical protein K456DRAFT_59695 [Colletotrichum gloeosporioides 23]|nr:hypothetical protein K456DRAFT_59695 [Colletotrichum gloeosporioides 23]